MDKLQPLVTHRFWIATGLAVILGLAGYWMGTSDLAAETDRLTQEVEGLKPSPGAAQPNGAWVDQAAEVAAERKARLESAARLLADTQDQLRVWPEGYRPYVEGLGHFGQISLQGREAYIDYYPAEVESVREVVRPYDPEAKEGVVAFAEGNVPQFNTSNWKSIPPESNTVWAAQEDVWLLRELLEQAVKVNRGYDSILTAPLKEIQELSLRGGGGATGAAAAGGGSTDMGTGSTGMATSMMGLEGDGMEPGGGGVGPKVVFDLDEEIGSAEGVDDDPALAPPAAAASPAGGGSGEIGTGSDMSSMMSEMGGGGRRGGSAEKQGAVSPGGGRRYITSAEGLPYRTRAFQMTVAIDHRRLPELLVNLTNCAWPVEIVRVHQSVGVVPAGHAGRPAGGGSAGLSSMGGYGESMMGGMGDMGGGMGGADDAMGGYGASMSGGMGGQTMGLGGGLGGGRGTPRDDTPAKLDPSDPYQVALADPYLATAVIGGVMTIYTPREETEVAADSADDPELAAAAERAAAANAGGPDGPADAAADPDAAGVGTADPVADASAAAGAPASDGAAVDAEVEQAADELDLGFDTGMGPAGPSPPADPPQPAPSENDAAENGAADGDAAEGGPTAAASGSGG